MGGIRKVSHPNRHGNFRRRLERALSLSPSDSESAQSPLRSVEGDTTEDESLQEENGFSSLQRGIKLVDGIPQDATENWSQGDGLGEELNVPKELEITESRNMIAFQCIAESIQGSLSTQMNRSETICSDLEDIANRLAAVETAIETMISEGQNTTAEGKMTGRTRRRQ